VNDLADPSSTTNKDGTVKENNEGSLDICRCGREFFVSFTSGFLCGECKNKNDKQLREKLHKFAMDAKREINENRYKRNQSKE